MNCIDEGVLQAYSDGELSTPEAGRVAAHLAACATCAADARDAGAEFAAFASAFSVDESVPVPSDRLLSHITAAIAASEGARTPVSRSADRSIDARLRAFAAALAAALAPRQAAVFAGVALAALLAGAIFFYTLQTKTDAPGQTGQPRELAVVMPTPAPSSSPQDTPGGGNSNAPQEVFPSARPAPAMIKFAAGGGSQKKGVGGDLAKNPVKAGPPRLDRRDAGAKEALLPVEREYLTEIASLSTAIEGKGADTLSPTLRAEYARSLAVVDQAIAASRDAARSNPRDADAREYLRTAYRDKLDLLSAVADRAQLAGLER